MDADIKQIAETAKTRLVVVDLLRGWAIAGVVVFHLVWDLEYTGFITGIAYHPLWLAFGRMLAGTFMFLVGVSLALSHGTAFRKKAFARRLAIIALSAAAITLVTWLAFPGAFVFFGILHSIAIASIVGLAFLKLPATISFLAGATVVAMPWFVSSDAFDTRWLAWIGFSANAPPSNDLVPVFPWIGVTLVGLGMAKKLKISEFGVAPDRLTFPLIAWMGRNSLAIYLIHQPVLLAIIIPLSNIS